ncbi:PAS domain S-box-containing protein [Pedobacter sp. CAN_A7]|uniref:hybrid sensor histidine kinase/response regulator n=1 Tax=Pedobacter sp. CAN_A7 TaxID=2787722 RepID=UPI0018CACB58
MNQFDNLCKLAALICNAPRAILVIKTDDQLALMASFGVAKQEVEPNLDFGLSIVAMEGDGCLEVSDTLIDDRFKNHRYVVEEPFLRSYFGVPLLDEHGAKIGAICVSDVVTKSLNEDQKQALDILAHEVITHVSLRRREKELELHITENKRVENKLTNLSFVASKVNNAIVINDADNNHVTWVNEAFEKITGFTLEDLKGRRLGDLISGPKTDVDLIEHARELNKNNESFTLDLLAYRKDKKPIWLSIYNTLIFDEDGKPTAEVEIIIDITDKKIAEAEMMEAKEQALQLSEAKEMFLSVMSHEIRTPLNAILGMTHLLLENDPKESQLDDLNILKFSGENLLHIVNDILDFTKIETGNLQLESIPFNLHNLINDILNSLQLSVSKKKNVLKLIYDQDIPERILGDKTRLYQVLMNLLGNAIKFTEKGEITLLVKMLSDGEHEVVLYFEVRDTGIGIAWEKQKYVFEPFTQEKADISRKYGGTGLGLAITKKLLQIFGSEIMLSSTEGQGSIFSFHIAFDKIPVINPTSVLEDALPFVFKGKRILVVDDNEINVLIAKRILGKWGLTVEVAGSGMEALDKVKNGIYDLVFMDVKMPDMDGFEATNLIRKMEGDYFKTLPIIALTASSLSDEFTRYKESGMNGHLMKPLNPAAFKQLLLDFFVD